MDEMREGYTERAHPAHLGGVQRLYKFDNGYGASVICTRFSYGGDQGLWELAVLNDEGRLDYDTPITDDVEGNLSEADVNALLDKIEALPKKEN